MSNKAINLIGTSIGVFLAVLLFFIAHVIHQPASHLFLVVLSTDILRHALIKRPPNVFMGVVLILLSTGMLFE